MTIPSSTFDSRFALFKPSPLARLNLFCFPHAGAGASIFHSWSRSLSPQISVCPVQLPGRENRLNEPPFTRLAPLVDRLSQALWPHMQRPFAIFGHSMGGLIGFELIRAIRRRYGLRPTRFFVSARHAPHLTDHAEHIAHLPDSTFVEELCRRYDGIPATVLQDAELMNMFLPILRADVELLESYTYIIEEPLDCPFSAFGGLQDRVVRRDHLKAWERHTTGSFSLRMFPGSHFFLNECRDLLLDSVKKELIEDRGE